MLEGAGQWAPDSAGVHEGRERREQATTFIFCIIYSFIFVFCAGFQRLPDPSKSLLPANTH